MTADLDHLYALADGALKLAFHWHTKTALEYDHTLEPEDAAYIAALSPDVVKGLIERVRDREQAKERLHRRAQRAESLLLRLANAAEHLNEPTIPMGSTWIEYREAMQAARTALEAKDE